MWWTVGVCRSSHMVVHSPSTSFLLPPQDCPRCWVRPLLPERPGRCGVRHALSWVAASLRPFAGIFAGRVHGVDLPAFLKVELCLLRGFSLLVFAATGRVLPLATFEVHRETETNSGLVLGHVLRHRRGFDVGLIMLARWTGPALLFGTGVLVDCLPRGSVGHLFPPRWKGCVCAGAGSLVGATAAFGAFFPSSCFVLRRSNLGPLPGGFVRQLIPVIRVPGLLILDGLPP
mmetsp:Transcript_16880/g.49149  ORF Transcript_16880/g.49149 Transcript_16880/m.49149 type:complete len:231 (-) Transcript_16880:574-1266(-)